MGFVGLAQGEITVFGRPVAEALRRNLVAYVPQAEEVDWNFPVLVEDVVMMGRYGHMNFLRQARPADRLAVDAALARVGMTRLSQAPDRRALGRPEEARLPRPRPRAGRPRDPPRRALHRRRRHHRGDDRRAPPRAARRGPADAGLDPQSGQRPRVLRSRRAAQGHRAGLRPDARGLHPGQSRARLRRRAAPFRPRRHRSPRRCRRAPHRRPHRRRTAARLLRQGRRDGAPPAREASNDRTAARTVRLWLHGQRHVGVGAGRRASAPSSPATSCSRAGR